MKTILIIGLLLSANFSAGQSFEELLSLYNKKMPEEKVYLHFDNTIYAPGQTVFFKAYLLRGRDLSNESKSLYLNWFDEDGNIMDRTIVPLNNYTWSGSYTIPLSYNGRKIQVLAHTKWMLNFDSSFLFHKTLSILQLNQSHTNVVSVLADSIHIKFMPEGGNLIQGLTSKVAFKATNTLGYPVQLSGTIKDKKGAIITNFSSCHDGMGTFLFTPPSSDDSYIAEWTDKNGMAQNCEIPGAQKSGVTLSINNDGFQPIVTIERQNIPTSKYKKLFLIGSMNQKVVMRATVDLSARNKITETLPSKKLPTGILILTIFDELNEPLAERVLFINNEQYSPGVTLNVDTLNLYKRGKNAITITLQDTVQASLSVSINPGEIEFDSSSNIISYLLLSSEIKGKIFNPAYYFSDNDSAQIYLDLVMLTNGWRRFKWEDVLNRKSPPIIYPSDTSYLGILGKMEFGNTKIHENESVNLILVSKDLSRKYLFPKLFTNGTFLIENVIFYDTIKAFYQVGEKLRSRLKSVQLNTTALPFDNSKKIQAANHPAYSTGKSHIDNQIKNQLMMRNLLNNNNSLQEVIVNSKIPTRVEQLDNRYTNGLFRDNGIQLNVVDDPVVASFPTVYSYLQNRATVPGLVFDMSDPSAPISWRSGGRKKDGITAIFLNEIQIKPQDISNLSMSEVAYIKIFRPPFAMAKDNGPGGAIAIYTKKGGEEAQTSYQSMGSQNIAGYSPGKEFYAETNAIFSDNKKTDIRQTLFWEPDILLNPKRQGFSLSFTNNDISRSYRIILNGVTSDGRIIYYTKWIH